MDVAYPSARDTAIEVVTDVGQDAQVMRLGKVISIGKIEAIRDIRRLKATVDIATRVQPGVAAIDLIYGLMGLRCRKRAQQAQSAGKRGQGHNDTCRNCHKTRRHSNPPER